MSEVTLTPSGPPETVIADEPPDVQAALAEADALDGDARREALAAVVVGAPRSLEAWARLGDAGRDVVEAYAAYRVGYHRGLDTLRANGWRGSGYVRCGIHRNRFRPTTGYFSGHGDQSRRWRVDQNGDVATSGMSGRIFGMNGTIVSTVPRVLRNGQTVRAGVFRCTYRTAVVTCANTRSGHGFLISNKTQRTF